MVAQSRAGVVRAVDALLLEQRYDVLHELVEPARSQMRGQHETVGTVGLHEVVDLVGNGLRGPDEGLPAGHLDDQLADAVAARLGDLTPLPYDGGPVTAELGPALRHTLPEVGVEVGQRTVRVVPGQVTA